MKTYSWLVLTLSSGVALGAVAATKLQAQVKPPVYAVIDISEVSDASAYIKAVSAAEPNASKSAGGRFIVRSTKPLALDGTAPNRFVVIAFDDEAKLKSWYNSKAVEDVNAVRMKTTKSRAFMVEGAPD